MKMLGMLLLVLQLGPLAGPLACLARPHCGMPQPAAAVTVLGGGGGMDHPGCWAVQVCSPAAPAVLPAAVAVASLPAQHLLALPVEPPLLAGVCAPPTPPPPRA